MTEAPPLDAAAFAALMAPLQPFEPQPLLACAVSGGADSLALLLLATRWAAARGGRVLALTVDHRLRPEAADEALAVAALARRLGAEHRTLVWADPPHRGSLQAAARWARLALLAEACRAAGCLHLLLAHHRDDQAETLLLRAGHGSGLDGLAGMAPQRRLEGLRLLRPLLPVPKRRLVATLRAAGLEWIEDPSNSDLRHERVRLRRALEVMEREGEGLAAAAEGFAALRRWGEGQVAVALGRAVAFHPAGCARLEGAMLTDLPRPLALRALAGVLRAIGGSAHAPRGHSLDRLLVRLRGKVRRAATLGGCRLLLQDDGLLVVREGAAAPRVPIRPGETLLWDRRFRVTLGPDTGSGLDPEGFSLGPLGEADRSALHPDPSGGPVAPLPGPARAALPALRYLEAVVAIPHLNLCRPGPYPAVVDCIAMPPVCAIRSDFTFGGRAGILAR